MKPEANENFRKVAKALAAAGEGSPSVFAFSGIERRGGNTTVVLNVARHLKASCNLSPLVVEVNVERPALADMFELDAKRSTSAVADGRMSPSECAQQCSLGFAVIPAAKHDSQNGSEPDVAGALRRITASAGEEYPVVLIDAPPVLRASGAFAVASVAAGLVLVVEAGHTRVEVLDRVKDELEQSGVRVIGAVLNKHRRFIPGWAYRVFVK